MPLFSYLKQDHCIIPSFWTFTTWIRSKNGIGTSERNQSAQLYSFQSFFGFLTCPTQQIQLERQILLLFLNDTWTLYLSLLSINPPRMLSHTLMSLSWTFFSLKNLCYNVVQFRSLKTSLQIHCICCICQVNSWLDWGTM